MCPIPDSLTPLKPRTPLFLLTSFSGSYIGQEMSDISLGSDATIGVTWGKLSDWQRRSGPLTDFVHDLWQVTSPYPSLSPLAPQGKALSKPLGWIISVTLGRHISTPTPTPRLRDDPLVRGKDIPEPSQLSISVYNGLVPGPPGHQNPQVLKTLGDSTMERVHVYPPGHFNL